MTRNQITENDIEYYKENLPLIETLRKRDEEIKQVKLQMTLYGLQRWWSVTYQKTRKGPIYSRNEIYWSLHNSC